MNLSGTVKGDWSFFIFVFIFPANPAILITVNRSHINDMLVRKLSGPS